MVIDKQDAEKIVGMFFDLVDAHYGSAIHHIGDGDGIYECDADKMREMYKKYADAYFTPTNMGSVFVLNGVPCLNRDNDGTDYDSLHHHFST